MCTRVCVSEFVSGSRTKDADGLRCQQKIHTWARLAYVARRDCLPVCMPTHENSINFVPQPKHGSISQQQPFIFVVSVLQPREALFRTKEFDPQEHRISSRIHFPFFPSSSSSFHQGHPHERNKKRPSCTELICRRRGKTTASEATIASGAKKKPTATSHVFDYSHGDGPTDVLSLPLKLMKRQSCWKRMQRAGSTCSSLDAKSRPKASNVVSDMGTRKRSGWCNRETACSTTSTRILCFSFWFATTQHKYNRE